MPRPSPPWRTTIAASSPRREATAEATPHIPRRSTSPSSSTRSPPASHPPTTTSPRHPASPLQATTGTPDIDERTNGNISPYFHFCVFLTQKRGFLCYI